MDMGLLTDPAVVTFFVFFATAIVSAVIWHAWVRRYLVAVVAAAVTGSVASYLMYEFARVGFIPVTSFFMATLPVCVIVAAGVGIPFNRRRTGKGLWEH